MAAGALSHGYPLLHCRIMCQAWRNRSAMHGALFLSRFLRTTCAQRFCSGCITNRLSLLLYHVSELHVQSEKLALSAQRCVILCRYEFQCQYGSIGWACAGPYRPWQALVSPLADTKCFTLPSTCIGWQMPWCSLDAYMLDHTHTFHFLFHPAWLLSEPNGNLHRYGASLSGSQASQGAAAAGSSVGATLGYAVALQGKQRVVACIGDGSFQVTAQARPPACRPVYSCLDQEAHALLRNAP